MFERIIYTILYLKDNYENKLIPPFIFTVYLPNLSMLCICNRCRCAGRSPVCCWRAWWSASQKECRDVFSRHKLMGTSCRHAPLQEKCRYELLKFCCKPFQITFPNNDNFSHQITWLLQVLWLTVAYYTWSVATMDLPIWVQLNTITRKLIHGQCYQHRWWLAEVMLVSVLLTSLCDSYRSCND